jgi:hypothetical protein
MVWSLLVFFHLLQTCYLVFGLLVLSCLPETKVYLYLLAPASFGFNKGRVEGIRKKVRNAGLIRKESCGLAAWRIGKILWKTGEY